MYLPKQKASLSFIYSKVIQKLFIDIHQALMVLLQICDSNIYILIESNFMAGKSKCQ
jgi:hypothetical protein